MFFNRLKFNRSGAVLYCEAVSISKTVIEAEVHNVLDGACDITAISKCRPQLSVIAYANSLMISEAFGRAWVYSPIYIGIDIENKSNLTALAYKSVNASVNLFSKTLVEARIFVETEIKSTLYSSSKFNALSYKYLETDVSIKTVSRFLAVGNAFRQGKFKVSCKAVLKANANVYAVELITFEGLQFKKGDVIEIDLCNYYATLNGQNIMDKQTGSFFKLYPDDNLLIWKDDKNQREIEMKIRYQNKYL